MTNLELEELAIQLNIPAVGVASWPLPMEASSHLDTPYPCPFTNGSIEERLQGSTTIASPKSAIVCLFPYYMPREGVTNLASKGSHKAATLNCVPQGVCVVLIKH